MDPLFRHAVARIDVMQAGRVGSRGTGFLVGDRHVLTALHVVADRNQPTLTLIPGDITLTFPSATRIARADEALWDARADWILLHIDPLSDVTPLSLADLKISSVAWTTFGFPDASPVEGMTQTGTVVDQTATFGNTGTIQLYSLQAAAGDGAPSRGLSGAPVIVQGVVVGLLRVALMREGRTVAGTLYACPIRDIVERAGGVLPTPADAIVAPEGMSFAPQDRLRRACGQVRAGALRATAYLVSPTRCVTSALALGGVPAGGTVQIAFDAGAPSNATIARVDAASDCAILELPSPIAGLAPLPFAPPPIAKTDWDCLAFLGDGTGIALAGAVADVRQGASTLQVRSTDFAGTAASSLEGLEGGPLLCGGGVVGHLRRRLASGIVEATTSGVLESAVMAADAAPAAEAAAPVPVTSAADVAADALRVSIASAAEAGDARLLALWKNLQAGVAIVDAALTVGEWFIRLGRADRTLGVLAQAGEGVRAEQLRALALAKSGDVDRSLEALVKLQQAGHLDAETGGILAGRYKQKWQQTGNRAFLRSAAKIYADTFARTHDTYPGINAAALALQLGDATESARIAALVLEQLAKTDSTQFDHWLHATLGEALLLSGDLAGARAAYERAVAACAMSVENIATMRRQARMDLKALNLAPNALDDVLAVPRVAAFTGHRVDDPGRSMPRFPSAAVGRVRRVLKDRLAQLQVGFGFSSAASGGDLMFIEEVIGRGGSARVYLPFPREDFVRTSVGADWEDRFARALAHERVEMTVIADVCPDEAQQPEAFRACAIAVQDAAVAYAASLDEEPTLLAIWDGLAGDGRGGTADAVRRWQETGYPFEQIRPAVEGV